MAPSKEAHKNGNLVTDKQKEYGVYQDGFAKEITEDGWKHLTTIFKTQAEARRATDLSEKWMQRQTHKYGYGWNNCIPLDKRPGETSGILKLLEKRYTREELDALAKGRSTPTVNPSRRLVDFKGDSITIGYYTDTHIGAKYFEESWFASMWAEYRHQKIDMAIHSGDVFEGMNSRPGHTFECEHIGFQAQRDYGIKIYNKYSMLDIEQNFIDGNHDRWFSKANGADIVNTLCDHFTNFNFLGQDEGDIILEKYGISIKPWHGEDGNSYATSYRIQKIVEAFSGGEKPHLLLTGHTHKAMYAMIRNVHCVSGGAMSRQSKWMRGKRIENHAGFWTIKMGLGKNDVKWVEPRFYSFYK